ncbi:glycosyltransferase family 2 protein [Prosthecobacter algae]|uniref:Glycosyltransferase family 2 protein n=1 Tax=Prosthecobacter algae TaxID=1144682 RepID=A0ABP9PMW0_9BACT
MPYPLSIAIISKNEEANLRRCLASAVGLAEEIVIVDSGSTDGTAAVAAEFGARFAHQEWLGFSAQKNLCNSFCTQPWILALDCDEELSPELLASIRAFFDQGDAGRFDAAWMARRVWFLGRWIRHGDWYPDKKVRLFRRDKGRWEGHANSQVHERLVVDGPHTTLKGDLYHYSFTDMAHYLDKHVVYTDVFADHEKASGRGWSVVAVAFRPWWRFVRAYIFRRGFLDGFPGFWIAVATAFFTFMRYSRAYEAKVSRKARDQKVC